MKIKLSIFLLLPFVFAFNFGNDPINQKYKKMTVMYRDFQGQNKNAFKSEEVIKNDKGLITSYYNYDDKGRAIKGSYTQFYDNNGNIKEKKNNRTRCTKGQRIKYSHCLQ